MVVQAKITINGRYRLLDELGRGGMGVVHRAYDRLFDRVVALKQVNFHAVAAHRQVEELRVLLAQEFHLLASLWHPNVIGVLDYGFDADRQPFYTMQWVEHHRTLIQAAQPVDLLSRLDLFRQTFEALEYLHRRGIVHYDLKPSNVLVDLNDQVRLMDFGLAAKLARYNVFAGTPTYMAPEVLRGQLGTPATDLYTVGVMLHEVFARAIPFVSGDGKLDLESVLHQPIDLPTLIAATGSAPLALVIARLLAKHPEDRYANARTALTALYRAFNETPPREAPVIRESHLRPPFVGREQPVAQLTEALDAAIAGHGSAWLIGGESGVGKSRLADELKAIALTRGVQVLNGQGIEDSGAPYQFWRLPLRQLVLQAPPYSIDASPLTMVIPDVEMLTGEPTRALHPDDSRRQEALIEAIRALFAAQTQPALLVLEDLQWARESLVPLAALIESCARLSLLIVGIYRSDEFGSLPKQLPGSQVIMLDRFGRDEIHRLTAAILGSEERAAHLVDGLVEQTEGNAFYLVEFMRLLAEMAGGLDAIGDEPPESGWMTEGIRALLLRRLNRIPAEDFLYLRYAAIIGRDIDFEALHSIDPTFDYNRWLATNVNGGILEVSVGSRVRFTHDKMREALLATIPDARRVELYWLVASAYEIGHADDPEYAFRLFSMWKEAGDADKMRIYAEEAIKVALVSNDPDTADMLLGALLDLTPPTDPGARARLLARKVDVTHLNGLPFTEVEVILSDIMYNSENVTDSTALVEIYSIVATIYSNYGSYADGISAVGRALPYAEALGDIDAQIDLWTRLTALHYRLGAIDHASDAQARAESLLTPDSPPKTRYLVRRFTPELLRAQGRALEAYQTLKALIEDFQNIISVTAINSLWANLGVAAWQLGYFDEAQQAAQLALDMHKPNEANWYTANMTNLLGYIAFDQQDYGAAAAYFRRALIIATQLGAVSVILDVLLGIARIRLASDDPDGAGELIGLALAHPESNEDVRITAAPILETLRTSANPVTVESALARGAALDLTTVVDGILL